MMHRALVVGGDSMLGSALFKALSQPPASDSAANVPVATTRRGSGATTRRDRGGLKPNWFRLDLMDSPPVLPTWSDIVYLVAAITKVVDCEANPQLAWKVNADAPVALALQCSRDGRHPIFISSDAVERAPNLIYSRTKAYAEGVILALGGTVVRPARILPDRVQGLVDLLLELGRTQSPGLVRWSP